MCARVGSVRWRTTGLNKPAYRAARSSDNAVTSLVMWASASFRVEVVARVAPLGADS